MLTRGTFNVTSESWRITKITVLRFHICDSKRMALKSALLCSHQCPEDREDPWCSQDEQASQGLRVVGFHDLDDPQQRLDPWSPQVTHVQPLQINQTRPAATEEEARGLVWMNSRRTHARAYVHALSLEWATASFWSISACHPEARLKWCRRCLLILNPECCDVTIICSSHAFLHSSCAWRGLTDNRYHLSCLALTLRTQKHA